jgi:hypothetical protein
LKASGSIREDARLQIHFDLVSILDPRGLHFDSRETGVNAISKEDTSDRGGHDSPHAESFENEHGMLPTGSEAEVPAGD